MSPVAPLPMSFTYSFWKLNTHTHSRRPFSHFPTPGGHSSRVQPQPSATQRPPLPWPLHSSPKTAFIGRSRGRLFPHTLDLGEATERKGTKRLAWETGTGRSRACRGPGSQTQASCAGNPNQCLNLCESHHLHVPMGHTPSSQGGYRRTQYRAHKRRRCQPSSAEKGLAGLRAAEGDFGLHPAAAGSWAQAGSSGFAADRTAGLPEPKSCRRGVGGSPPPGSGSQSQDHGWHQPLQTHCGFTEQTCRQSWGAGQD